MNELRQTPSFSGSSSVASRDVVRALNVPHARVLITERPTRWRKGVLERLNQLCHLSRGWDGYDAGPIDFRIGQFAVSMLESICSPDTPAPSIVPGTNGDLQIEWHWAGGDIELHVRAPSDVYAWRETPDTSEDGDEFNLTVDFTQIVDWIREIAEPASAIISAAA